jgi:DNA-binding transcriptional regulator YdaS (Cro superfamily)
MAPDSLPISSLPPAEAARRLAQEVSDDWLAEFAGSLPVDSHRLSLRRILTVWGLSQSQAAETFGVSRQAVSKWIGRGVPAERLVTIADMDAATDILCHYLRRERIPAVVRRTAPGLSGLSLLGMVAEGRSADMLAAVRSMFMFGSTSPR